MKGFSMDVEVQELSNDKLPDGRTVVESWSIGKSYQVVRVKFDGQKDTVFMHAPEGTDEPDIFIGLCFNPNIEAARNLHLCVRSCTDGSNYSPEVLYEFQAPKKLWSGCYKIETLTKTFYVKTY